DEVAFSGVVREAEVEGCKPNDDDVVAKETTGGAEKKREELEDRLQFVKSPIPPKASDTTEEDRPVLKEDLGSAPGSSHHSEEVWQPQRHFPESAKLGHGQNTESTEDAGDGGSEGPSQAGVYPHGASATAHLAHERRTAPGTQQLPVTSGYVGGAPNTKPAKSKGKGKRREQPNPAPLPPPSLPQSLGPPARRHSPSQDPPPLRRIRRHRPKTRPRTEGERCLSKSPKRARRKDRLQPNPPRAPCVLLPPAPANVDTPWVEVARRKKKGKPAAAPTNITQPPKPTRRKEPKLRPPRSAAVVCGHGRP
ncbi:serine/arginine repetitive matrix protein 1-like, partial [Manduca sexta]|uniref:serine/arginine repetitive matrix protein 1-like n=1 Tax=Manduca sexta TaxID=7130 RepID=UPI00188DE7FF